MGEHQGIESTSPVNENQTGQQQEVQDEINPVWNDLLGSLPSVLHQQVIPHLKKWDEGVNKKFEESAAKYKDYDPIIESIGDPEALNNAVGLMQALEADPKKVWDLIAQQYGFQVEAPQQQQQQQQLNIEDIDDPQEKVIAQLKQQIEEQGRVTQQLVQYLHTQQAESQKSEQQKQLESHLKQLHEANKDFNFDDNYVIAQIANGKKGQQAVDELKQMVLNYAKSLNSKSDDAPVVSGAGGGLPSQKVDVSNMSDKQTVDLVTQMLQAAAQDK